MNIDFGRLITRTWEIVWRNRVLWILGFIVALVGGGFNFNTSFNTNRYSTTGADFGAQFTQFWTQWGGLLVGLGCLAFIVALLFLYLSAAAQAALIATTDYVERGNEPPSFAAAWGLGWRKAGPLFGLNLLVLLIVLLIVGVLGAVFFGSILGLIGVAASSDGSNGASGAFGGFGLVFCCLCILMVAVIPLGIVVALVLQYAPRAIVLDNQGIFESLGSGWRMLRANVGASLLTALITIGVGIAQAIITIPVTLIVAAPAIFTMINDPENIGAGSIISLLFFTLLGRLLAALIGALFAAYGSVLWTLLYRHLRGMPNGDLSPVAIYPPGGGYYPGPQQPQQPPYGGQYGTPTAPMQPPYGQPGGYQPPYNPPAQGGYQPPQGQPGQGGYQPPANPGQYGGPYNPPPQDQPPGDGGPGRVSRE